MNCTGAYFRSTVWIKNSHKRMYSQTYIGILGARDYIFALDTLAESRNDITWKLANVSHIWESGCVIKDSDNSFAQLTSTSAAQALTGNVTNTLIPSSPSIPTPVFPKIDQSTFLNQVAAQLPTSYYWSYTCNMGYYTIFFFALGSPYSPSKSSSYQELLQNCNLAWENDTVIKDRFGIFGLSAQLLAISGGPNTISNTPSNATVYINGVQMPTLEYADVKINVSSEPTRKCGCGAHSVNSHKHDKWCDLFTKESA
jgi:hypothetical protein